MYVLGSGRCFESVLRVLFMCWVVAGVLRVLCMCWVVACVLRVF